MKITKTTRHDHLTGGDSFYIQLVKGLHQDAQPREVVEHVRRQMHPEMLAMMRQRYGARRVRRHRHSVYRNCLRVFYVVKP